MAKEQQSWDKTLLPDGTPHIEWLRANAPKYEKAEIAEFLGRSIPSVEHKLEREGLKCGIERYTEAGGEEVEGISVTKLLKSIKDKPRSLSELSNRFDRSEETLRRALERLIEEHYEITQTETRRFLWSTKTPGIVAPPTILWDKDVWEFKLGIMGDTHDGSKYAQISARNRAIQIMYERGVREVLVVGDINAGRGIYRGQELDVVSLEADDQIAISRTYWPRYDGMRFHMMSGNHDFGFVRAAGYNALKALCSQRDDFFYWGADLVTVPITDSVDALLWHPKGGPSYALSYKAQKMVANVAFQQLMEVLEKNVTPKVRFLFVGHWHQMLTFWQGPIFVALVGCFEGQTNHLKALGLYPQIGAMILDVAITKDRALIREMNITHLQFTEIDGDYLNYPIPHEAEEFETLFKFDGDENAMG